MKRTLNTTINRSKIEKDGAHNFPFYDGNGNVTRYLDASGATVTAYAYDAFGNRLSASGPMANVFSHRFSTKYFDRETGLYYYGYRFYAPMLGRWINRDPIEEKGGVNLYLMGRNCPVSCIDILGLIEVVDLFTISPLSLRYKKAGWKYMGWPFGFYDKKWNNPYKVETLTIENNGVESIRKYKNCETLQEVFLTVEPKKGRAAFFDGSLYPPNDPTTLLTGYTIGQNIGPDRIEFNYWPVVTFSEGEKENAGLTSPQAPQNHLWRNHANMEMRWGVNTYASHSIVHIEPPKTITITIGVAGSLDATISPLVFTLNIQ